jgi:uncharacterized RDD family membrane protein YckC
MKKCSYCSESIQDEAKKCRFCGEWLHEGINEDSKSLLSSHVGSNREKDELQNKIVSHGKSIDIPFDKQNKLLNDSELIVVPGAGEELKSNSMASSSPTKLNDYSYCEVLSDARRGSVVWDRWLARIIDLRIGVLALSFVIGFIWEFVGTFVSLPTFNLNQDDDKLFSFILIIPWMVIEAFIIAKYGTTPGKALLGIRLKDSSGSNLKFRQALWRNGHVWWRGLGTGFPLISAFTMAHAHGVFKKTGSTSWDRDGNFRVQYKEPRNPYGMGIGLIILILLTAFPYILESKYPNNVKIESKNIESKAWVSYSDPKGTFTTMFPTAPVVSQATEKFNNKGTFTTYQFKASQGGLNYSVSVYDYLFDDPDVYFVDKAAVIENMVNLFKENIKGVVVEEKPFSVGVIPAREVYMSYIHPELKNKWNCGFVYMFKEQPLL